MSSHDVFAQGFRQLLAGIPQGTSLAQWQHMYRQAVIEMGLTIGEKFKEEAARVSGIGRQDNARVAHGNPIEDAEAGGHHGPGPHLVVHLLEFALGIGFRFR
jgi:hypothetical protein